VQMPEMDGFEATRCIREIEQSSGHRTPIVAMTAHAMTGDRERCLAAGMDNYVSKPLRKQTLLRILNRFQPSSSSSSSSPSSNLEAPANPPQTSAIISTREQLLDHFDGDEEMLQKLIALFTESTPKLLDAMRESSAQRDAARLAGTAHKLLSSLGAVGAEPARKLASQLEEQAQRKEIAAAEATLADLARELAKVSEALEELSGVCV